MRVGPMTPTVPTTSPPTFDAGLAADENLHAFAAQRQVEDLHQRGLVFEQLEQLAHAAHVLRQVMHREQVALAGDHVLLAAFRDRLVARFERRIHEAHHVLPDLAQLLVHAVADVLEAVSGIILVDVVRRGNQFRRAVVAIGEQDPVEDVAVRRDDDQQHALFRQPQEFDLAETQGTAPRRHHDAGEIRQLGQQLRGGLDHPLRVVRVELVLELVQLSRAELLHHQQRIDEEAVAERGVGTCDEPHLLEIRHDVADRRRRKVQTGVP